MLGAQWGRLHTSGSPAQTRADYAPLRHKLRRLAAAAAPPPDAAAAAGTPAPPPAGSAPPPSFVSDGERRTLSSGQVEFLERKRRAAAGLGPFLPEAAACERCSGSGMAVCHQCGGSGVNAKDMDEEIFNNERGVVVQRNGMSDNRWFFRADCPCWLCRGSCQIGCPDCSGSGMRTDMSNFIAD